MSHGGLVQVCKCLFYGYGSAIWVLHGPATSLICKSYCDAPIILKNWLSALALTERFSSKTKMRNLHNWHFLVMGLAKFLRPVRSHRAFHSQQNIKQTQFHMSLTALSSCMPPANLPVSKWTKKSASTRGTCLSKIVSWTLGTCKPTMWCNGCGPFWGEISTFKYLLDYDTKMKILPDFPGDIGFVLKNFPILWIVILTPGNFWEANLPTAHPSLNYLFLVQDGWNLRKAVQATVCPAGTGNREHYHWDSWLVKKILRSCHHPQTVWNFELFHSFF